MIRPGPEIPALWARSRPLSRPPSAGRMREPVRMTRKPTLLLGLIGYGIQGSLTPAMHEREGAEQGFQTVYKLIDLQKLGIGAEALPQLLNSAEQMGFAGLNITFPC